MVTLGEVVDINPRLTSIVDPDEEVAFVPMAELNSATGTTSLGTSRPFAEVSKGYTPFKNGDILVAKITPCFENMKIGHARLSRELGMGSTEFHVIRPVEERLDHRYLLHFLRREEILRRGELRMTGSGGQRRVPAQFLSTLQLQLPPLDEQRRIAAILDRAGSQLENTRRAASLLESLGQAVFHQMFSDRNCETVLLGDLIAQHQLGLDKRTSELGPLGKFSYLKMDSITRAGGLDLSRATRVDCSPEEFEKYSLREGDLIFNTRNARNLVGKSTVYRGPATIFNNNILRLRFAEAVQPDFIHQFLWSKDGRQQLDARKSGTTSVWAIYFKSLKTIKVPVPGLESQAKFSIRLRNVRTQVDRYRKREASLEKLLRSLESRAFRGEL